MSHKIIAMCYSSNNTQSHFLFFYVAIFWQKGVLANIYNDYF